MTIENDIKSKAGDPDMNVMRQVSLFNYGLARLYVLLDILVNLREEDILMRREKFKRDRAERVDANERKRVRNNQLREEMAEAEALEGDEFNQAEWLAAFNEANPEIEIPHEPKRDVDMDYDVNEEFTYREGDEEAVGDEEQGLEEHIGELERKNSDQSGKDESQ